VRPDRIDRLKNLNLDQSIGDEFPANGLAGTTRETQLRLLEKAFGVWSLGGLPSSWGRSLSSLQSQLRPVATLDEKTPITLTSLEQTDKHRYKITGNPAQLKPRSTCPKARWTRCGLASIQFLLYIK